ncbi:MAG: choice-of-anchor B family protein, partial [Thermoanaerobaculia bacterium]
MSIRKGSQSLSLCLFVLVGVALAPVAQGQSSAPLTETMVRFEADSLPGEALVPEHEVPCVGGMSGSYPCSNVDLLEFMPLSAMGSPSADNDIWGWTAQPSGREFALVGQSNGTAFVEITDPEAAVYLGRLPSTGNGNSSWRDIKVYADHAFIVSDNNGNHGMQVFDLTQLLAVGAPPVTFTESFHYNQIGSAHNIAINEATGFAYIVGGSSAGSGTICSGGLHMVDIHNPDAPVFAGCFSADGYTHDTQCIVYSGPDTEHVGQEICFNSNEDTLTIVNVTNKSAPVQISRTGYPGSGYTHQAWLTEDQHYILLDDELDESHDGHNTYTYVWDVANLESPVLRGHFTSPTPAIDHNQYVKGNFVFQANYRSGLRILRIEDLANAALTPVGYFDIYPANDTANFNGAWSVYPYFPSGNIVVNGIEQGLFVLRPNLCTVPPGPTNLSAIPNGDQRIDVAWTGSGTAGNLFTVERAAGGCSGAFETIASGLPLASYSDTSASGQISYGYRAREKDSTGYCASVTSDCAEATTTGACTAPPIFPGLASATNAATSSCRVDLSWTEVGSLCGGPVTYDIYRGTDELFLPSASNRIAQGVSGNGFADGGAPSGFPSFYVVRARDGGNGSEEGNLVRRQVTATGPVGDGSFTSGAEIGDSPLDTLTGGDTGSALVPEHAGWHPVETREHSGARSFSSGAAANACITLEGDFTLTAGQSSQLSFWTVWDLEATYDGGIVQVSTNGGGTWTTVTPAGGYPNSISNPDNACPAMPVGTAAFSSDDQFTWLQKTVNLAAYAGQSIRVAWRFGSDSAVNGEGWYVDDITL